MQPVAFLFDEKREGDWLQTWRRLPVNAEKRKLQSCGLRVAPEIGLQYAVDRILSQNATRNFYAYVFFALYLFVY